MRVPHLALLAALLASAPEIALAASPDDVARARPLDQQGVRAYREERYNDAIRYFQEAFKLGGPATELWNIARCQVHLDEPEEAVDTIEKYLDQKGLSPGDRAEAEAQLRELQRRHSTLTVASSPSGASVFIDGHHPAGSTPATIDVPPGSHTVDIEHAGYERYSKSVDAKYGRAVIVDAKLDKSDDGPPSRTRADSVVSPDATTKYAAVDHRLLLEAQLGVMAPRYGSIGGSASVAGFLSVAYAIVDAPRAIVTIGARATITGDSWSNTIGAPTTNVAGCGTLPSDFGATSFGAFVAGGAAWRATRRLRVGGDLGLGVETLGASRVGGDLFAPSCSASPGVKPAIHVGLEGSYAISRELRVVVSPLIVEISPAFDGTRDAPKDASGPWMRFGAGIGLAFDVF